MGVWLPSCWCAFLHDLLVHLVSDVLFHMIQDIIPAFNQVLLIFIENIWSFPIDPVIVVARWENPSTGMSLYVLETAIASRFATTFEPVVAYEIEVFSPEEVE